MRLVLTRDLSGAETRFRVYDDLGRLSYRVEGEYAETGSVQRLLCADGREIAAVSQKKPVKSVYTVSVGGVPAIRIFRSFHYIYPCCRLFDLGWRIRGNLLHQEYEVLSLHDTVILEQKRIWSSLGESFELIIPNPKYQVACLGIAVAVNDTTPVGPGTILARE